jgi:hypothetical protein
MTATFPSDAFDSKTIIEGLRRRVVDGEGAHTHYERMYISSIEPRPRLLHRLYQTLR